MDRLKVFQQLLYNILAMGTIHATQGKTYNNTIAAIMDNNLLNNQKAWLIALSKHKSEFIAIVEDKDKLKSYLMRNNRHELSAIELVQNKFNQGNALNSAKYTDKMINSEVQKLQI